MSYPLTDFFRKVVEKLSPDGVFAIMLALIVCGFSAVMIQVAKGKSGKPCIVFAIVCSAGFTVFSAIILIAETSFTAFAFYFAFSTALISVLTLIISLATEKHNDYSEQKELVRYIDGEIKKQDALSEEKSPEPSVLDDVNTPSDAQLDFTHVKNVIGRLDCYDLSASDRTRIEDLKNLLFYAEKYGVKIKN